MGGGREGEREGVGGGLNRNNLPFGRYGHFLKQQNHKLLPSLLMIERAVRGFQSPVLPQLMIMMVI